MADSKTAPGPVGSEMARKLSVKELGWTKPAIQKTCLDDQKARHFLARFVGVASALKPYRIKSEGDRDGQIAYGLVGAFEGTNADGEVKNGTVLYLPGFVNEMIAGILSTNEDVAGVRIAYDVYARYDESAATSYVFDCFDLVNSQADNVAEVKASIGLLPMPAKQIALPAS